MIRRELTIFLIVGSMTVLLDYLTYRSLIWIELMNVDMAKATSFLVGTIFAYFANRFWTFSHELNVSGSVWRFILLYTATLGANVLVNSLALELLDGASVAIQISFLLATGVSACLNFVGMKYFVFTSRSDLELL